MKDDPIVQKVREIRDAYAAEFNYDLNALYEDIKRQEQANQKPHHRLTPKRIACFSVVETRNRVSLLTSRFLEPLSQKPGFLSHTSRSFHTSHTPNPAPQTLHPISQ